MSVRGLARSAGVTRAAAPADPRAHLPLASLAAYGVFGMPLAMAPPSVLAEAAMPRHAPMLDRN